MCQDKTIRNRQSGLVLTAKRGSKDVKLEALMWPHQDYDVYLAQKWNPSKVNGKKDGGGIEQDVF